MTDEENNGVVPEETPVAPEATEPIETPAIPGIPEGEEVPADGEPLPEPAE